MKRFFFSLIALSAAAIGCTQSELLDTPGLLSAEVSFSPYTGRTLVTKATSIEGEAGLANADASKEAKADPNGFYVYGFLNKLSSDQTMSTSVYMNNVKVYSPSKAGKDWTYDNLVYWPDASSTSTLSFVAYSANAVGKGLSDVTEDGFTFTVQENIDNQVDLLATAYQDGLSLNSDNIMVSEGNVVLHFYHLLSRVGFKVKTSTNKSVIITSLSLEGKMPDQGTLTFTDATGDEKPYIETSQAKDVKEYVYVTNGTTPITGANTNAVRVPRTGSDYMMIMPHSALEDTDGKGSDHYINVSYKIQKSGNEYTDDITTVVRLPIGFEFAAGRAYEIILEVSTSSLTFNVTEEPWGSKDTTVGPLEPDQEEEEEQEQEPDTYNNSIVISSPTIGITFATFTFQLTQDYNAPSSWGSSSEVGIAYRKSGDTNWQRTKASGVVMGTYEISIENLEPGQNYEYCAYSGSKSGLMGRWSYKYYSGQSGESTGLIKTFTTLPATPAPSQITHPSVIADAIEYDDLTSSTAVISGSCTLGQVVDNDGTKTIRIKEYGLCWCKSDDEPTTTDDQRSWTVADGDTRTSFTFATSNPAVTGLSPYRQYSYRAYIITSEDVYAYVRAEGQEGTVKTLIYPKNTVIYSDVKTFTTLPSGGDDAGGDWEDGGETEFASNQQ